VRRGWVLRSTCAGIRRVVRGLTVGVRRTRGRSVGPLSFVTGAYVVLLWVWLLGAVDRVGHSVGEVRLLNSSAPTVLVETEKNRNSQKESDGNPDPSTRAQTITGHLSTKLIFAYFVIIRPHNSKLVR